LYPLIENNQLLSVNLSKPKIKIMKSLFIAIAFAFTGIASAQTDVEDEIQNNQDKIQQEPPRDTQKQMDRAAKIDAEKRNNNANIDAEKKAKEKGQSKNYTKVNPDKLKPVTADTIKAVEPVKKPRNK